MLCSDTKVSIRDVVILLLFALGDVRFHAMGRSNQQNFVAQCEQFAENIFDVVESSEYIVRCPAQESSRSNHLVKKLKAGCKDELPGRQTFFISPKHT